MLATVSDLYLLTISVLTGISIIINKKRGGGVKRLG